MTVGVIATAAIVLGLPVYAIRESRARAARGPLEPPAATFVGAEKCVRCHEAAYESWRGSDHDWAMAVANDSTVRGDFQGRVFEYRGVTSRFYKRNGKFYVHTQGPDGVMGEFEIAYTFGYDPLQQYLIAFPGGRLQALSIAWDVQKREWFFLYPGQVIQPGDWLHWTRGAQNWNGMCAECHSTNLIKGYDPESRSFSTTWSEINVSCEACHGPGSRHVAWAEIPPMARPELEDFGLLIKTSGISAREQVELCAPCHSRRTELGDYDHTRSALLDNQAPTVLEEGLYHADGQILEEVYEYASFTQSKMFRMGVRCSDCHDAHSLKLHRDGNALCLQCHRADVYDTSDHHFHKKVYRGKPSDGALCVKCHMPERPYMVIDWRADHSIRLPRPDLTLEIGVPNACSQGGCHDDRPVGWSADHYRRWYGQAKKPHYGTIIAAARAARPEAQAELIKLAGDPLYPAIVRATALALLTGYSSDSAGAAVARALSDEEGLVRHTAVTSVVPSSAEELVELAAPLLFDPLRAVRLQAASRLAGLSESLFKPYQREALRQELAEYVKAMEYSLDFAFAGHNLGNLYVALREPARAESYYREAIRIDDLSYPPKVNLAVLLNSQGRNAEAETLLREVLSAYPELHDVEYSLGLLLAEMQRYPEAAEYMERAARALPERSRIFYNLGLIEQQLGRAAPAEAALRRALELEPEALDYLHALADHYVKRGELRRALDLAERMIASHPESPLGPQLKAYIESALAASSPDR